MASGGNGKSIPLEKAIFRIHQGKLRHSAPV
jgi:hypothetical protein